MLIGGKEYKTGQRIDEYARANLRVDEPYSEHYRNGMTRLFCDDEIELLEE